MGRSTQILVGVTTGALLLRLLRAALRWDEIALAYAAYYQPWTDALHRLDFSAILGEFTGLHPPLYALVHALLGLWGAPAAWLLFSVLCSTLAVWVVGRSWGAGAACVLAVDPLQLAYAAEVNNYPLLVLGVALLLSRLREARRGRTRGLVFAGILCTWTHLLGGLVAGCCALTLAHRDRRVAIKTLLWILLGSAPVLVMAGRYAFDGGIYGQGGLDLALILGGLKTKLGWWGLLFGVALVAVRRQGAVVFVLVASALGILGMVGLGIAAPHQQPYYLVLGPPLAVLLSSLGRGLGPLLGGLGLITVLPAELEVLGDLRANLERERAIDLALAGAGAGDALWLLSPALKPDDDKTDRSDVLWRFSPWRKMRPWRGPGGSAFEFVDYRYGQPREMGGRVVHTSTDMEREVFAEVLGWHAAEGRRVGLVLYDHGPAQDYPGLVDRVLAGHAFECEWVGVDVGLGVDRLCWVEGP